MVTMTLPHTHFAAAGNRVERSYDYVEGTVIESVSMFEVVVRWDDPREGETIIDIWTIEPIETAD